MGPHLDTSQRSLVRCPGIGFTGVAGLASRLAWCLLASVLLSLCAALAHAQAQEAAPPRSVFPAFTGRVVDTAGLLDAAAEARLDGVLAAHEAATTDQVVVVTLASLGGMAVEDFGYQLGRTWGVGQRGKDNGVLLIVSRDDRKLRIEVGYGLEGRLTDADASAIINQTITPAFRQNDYAGGIEQGVAAILQRLAPPSPMAGEADASLDSPHRAPVIQRVQTVNHISETFIGFVAVIFGGFTVVMFLVFHGNPFRRKPAKSQALMLGASAAGAAGKRSGTKRSTCTSSSSSSSSSSRSGSSSSSSSSRSSSSRGRGGGGSFGGGGASGGW